VSTPLQQWRQHRADYRAPLLVALLLLVGFGGLMPEDWLDLPWLGSSRRVPPALGPFLHLGDEEGLQVLDVEVLGAPTGAAPVIPGAPERVVIAPTPADQPAELPGRGEFGWDPTHAYRGAEELLIPGARRAPTVEEEKLRRLEYLLSQQGAASYSLGDTSQVFLAHSSFTRLQRELFARQAPIWAYEKALERYREMYNRLLFDNPLRGPQ
jgi:hypothetical protein